MKLMPFFSLIKHLINSSIDFLTLYTILFIFLATLVRSIFGFGESLVAVPLLALYVPLEIAVPVSVLVSITVAGVVVAQDWKKIHVRSAGWMVLFTLMGLPLGLILLTTANDQMVKARLAVVIDRKSDGMGKRMQI